MTVREFLRNKLYPVLDCYDEVPNENTKVIGRYDAGWGSGQVDVIYNKEDDTLEIWIK